ncbi:hypothetical protein [Nocardia sp. NPDC058666]|uniref:hypothetical protein n=1 Tax=Nocardia sp. NPDC058666 TaxID=3346587 RepID=UPI00364E01C0
MDDDDSHHSFDGDCGCGYDWPPEDRFSKRAAFIGRAATVALWVGVVGFVVAITIGTAGLTAWALMLALAAVTDEDRDKRLAAAVFGIDVFGATLLYIEPTDEITTWYGYVGIWLTVITGAATLCYLGITLCYLGIVAILEHRHQRDHA